MHDSARRSLAKFYFDYKSYINGSAVADLGALNINGSTKDIIHHSIGFDIVQGPGVDVVIEPGAIPDDQKGRYGAVISISSFQCCPDPALYKKQIMELLAANGILFLTMCSNKCHIQHSTSNNAYGFQDSFRLELRELERFFSIDFDVLEIAETNYDHPDYVLVAKLKS